MFQGLTFHHACVSFQWTFCVAACMAIGAAIWFYLVPLSIKHMVYAPTVLIGCGVSGLLVMSLSFVTDVMWADKVQVSEPFSFIVNPLRTY